MARDYYHGMFDCACSIVTICPSNNNNTHNNNVRYTLTRCTGNVVILNLNYPFPNLNKYILFMISWILQERDLLELRAVDLPRTLYQLWKLVHKAVFCPLGLLWHTQFVYKLTDCSCAMTVNFTEYFLWTSHICGQTIDTKNVWLGSLSTCQFLVIIVKIVF